MSVRVVDRVDGWDQRPFRGGFDTLHDLADDEFSGVVRAGGAELYMTVGTAVAVRRGTIDDFDGASGTTFEAPVPALPLLAVMQEEDVDVRAEYYSEETPISEVDGTLSDGGFTGYVELSENVLSGDYFLVYHGGNSMSVAFVGTNDKLITDDEAFQTADDEVGIYKVRQVDVEPVEIPEPEQSADSAEATAAAATAEGGAEAESAADAGTSDGPSTSAAEVDDGAEVEDEAETDEAAEPDDAADPGGDEASEAPADAGSNPGGNQDAAASAERSETSAPASAERSTASEPDSADGSDGREVNEAAAREDAAPAADGTATTDDAASTADAASRDRSRDESAGQESTGSVASTSEPAERAPEPDRREGTGSRSAGAADQQRSRTRSESGRASGGRSGGGGGRAGGRSTAPQPSNAGSGSGGTAPRQAGDLETRSIPSLDPSHTQAAQPEPTPDPAPEPRGEPRARGGRAGTEQPVEPEADRARESEPARGESQQPAPRRDPDPAEDAGGTPDAALEELESELADREAEVERLETELADAESEREDLEADLAAVREERDDLAEQVERLEEELERLEGEFGAATDAETRMTPSEAIEATNLFVEYDSKGDATLEDAHEGTEGREAVAENLRLGVHTEFDDRAVAVGGQDFGEFLRSTLHYRFAEWVIGDLLFEVRDTGHADALPDLYDAIRAVRRVEFNGVVDVEYVEDGQDKSGRERFDVIFRHRMGDPLLVANLNDSREPATGNMMTSLVTSAERVGQTEDALAAAFLVTSSFFESEALETVSEATQGGLLSRDSRKSFVNLSRKAGYHLCLVAARDGNFHMEVPEL